jgi:probable rRNA maturation factor
MEPPSSQRISVLNQSGRRVPVSKIRDAANLALPPGTSDNASVCVLLATDEQVRELNLRFRGLDESTDVLSFPAAPMPGHTALGDIAIAVPYAERQAALRGTPLDVELCYLAIHGVLHLLGYEDEEPAAREQMLLEMNRVGGVAGLPADPEWSSVLHEEKR